MKKKTVLLILASSIVLGTINPVIAAENLINLQDAEVAQQIETLAEGNNNCPTKEIYEEAANGIFNKIGEKGGIYKATYYPNAKIAEILIIDKSKAAKELTDSAFVDEIYNLYKNHNLVKFKIGNEVEKSLDILAKDLEEAEIKNTFKNSFSTDLINSVQTGGSGTGKISDFVNKEFQIQLTFKEPSCNDSVDLTYIIRGKEAIASVMKNNIKAKDINVWKGAENINWKDGVEIIQKPGENQEGLKRYLEQATVEDASSRNAQNPGTQIGSLKLTFTDGTSLLLNEQNLNVFRHAISAEEKNAPADAIDVTFKLGEGVEAGQDSHIVIGNKENPVEYRKYKVKPGLDFSQYKYDGLNNTLFELLSPRAIKGYENPTWNPNDFVVSKTNNVFVASAKVKSSAPEDKDQKPVPKPNPDKKESDKKDENKNKADSPRNNGNVNNSKNNKDESPKNNNKGLNYNHLNNLSNKNSNTKVVKKDESSKKNKATYVFNINNDEFEITINGTTIKSKMYTSPVIKNGRTMLPLRNIAEAIGVEVNWDSKTRTATFTKDGLTASIQVDGDEISYSNGKVVKMDSKPIIKDNRILVSLVNVANIFGLTNGNLEDSKDQDIEWNKDNNTVTINLKK